MRKLKQETIHWINEVFGTNFEINRFGSDTKGNLDLGYVCVIDDKLHIQAQFDGIYVDLTLPTDANKEDIKDALSIVLFNKRETYYNLMQRVSQAIVKLSEDD